MRGTIKNSGCVSNATYMALRGRNNGSNTEESFAIGRDSYHKRYDGTCWKIENGAKHIRIKNAVYLELKKQAMGVERE